MKVETPDPNNYRYERKFIVSELTRYEIEALVKLHPAMFSEIYHPRFVNNLYFDSFSMKNYYSNVDGLLERVKVRIRWYGDLFGVIERPVLEVKVKNGSLGRKESFPLTPFSVDEDLQLDTILGTFEKSDMPQVLKLDLNSLEFSLLNRYRRKYFVSADRKYRITIDTEMVYCHIQSANNTFLHKLTDLMNTVVELKYGPGEDQYAEQVTNHFPFRMTKNSKYVNGIDRLSWW